MNTGTKNEVTWKVTAKDKKGEEARQLFFSKTVASIKTLDFINLEALCLVAQILFAANDKTSC